MTTRNAYTDIQEIMLAAVCTWAWASISYALWLPPVEPTLANSGLIGLGYLCWWRLGIWTAGGGLT